MNNTMEGLYRLDKGDKFVPGVAKSSRKIRRWKKVHFKLREDAKWSNGDTCNGERLCICLATSN